MAYSKAKLKSNSNKAYNVVGGGTTHTQDVLQCKNQTSRSHSTGHMKQKESYKQQFHSSPLLTASTSIM